MNTQFNQKKKKERENASKKSIEEMIELENHWFEISNEIVIQ